MEKITKEIIITAIKKEVFHLTATQNKLCIPIINRIYKKMIYGIKFDDIKVCDNLIIDGHHRYISSILAKIELGVTKSSKTSATIEYKWLKIEFVEEEWDTQNKIEILNQLDAAFNNIPLEKIIEMTK